MLDEKREALIRPVIFVAFGLSGMAALIYEVVWTRSLSIVMGSSTYALSTMLAAFMAGLSIGGFLGGRLSERLKRPAVAFALCELGIGLAGIITVPVIKALTPVYIASFYAFHLSFSAFSAVQFILIFLIMGIPTTLMGLSFPIVIKYFSKSAEGAGRQSGRLYGINTFGAILGSLSAGFLLIPVLGVRGTSIAAAAVNILIASVILFLSKQPKKLAMTLPSVVALLVFSAVIDAPEMPVFSYYSAFRFNSYEDVANKIAEIKDSGKDFFAFRREGVEGNVYLTKYNTLINNAKWEAGDERAFSLLAYLPYVSYASGEGLPKTALNIGLGSGHTLSVLSRFPTLSKIDSVELNQDIIDVNRRFLNPGLFSDPRISHVHADGRNFLLMGHKPYDLILISPSWAVESGSAGFLTEEFLSLAASRLTEDGVIALWVDYFLMDESDREMVLRTFSKHFRRVTDWHILGDNMILTGSNSPNKYGDEFVEQAVLRFNPSLRGYFAIAASEETIKRLPEGATNTDDRPLIEFHNARNIILGPERLRRKAPRSG